MTIGKVAKSAGIGIETIRFYERRGLLDEPARRESGYRQYDREVITRLRFIKRAQELGFSLKEIEELLSIRRNTRSNCGDVKAKTTAKIAEIERKIEDLKRIKAALRRVTNVCPGKGALSICPILAAFEKK
jgi:MerR family mercuric resistance operon transcriptional regulator